MMLKDNGFNFGKEFKLALQADLSLKKNQEYLEVLFRILPYIAVRFADSDAKVIEDMLKKFDTKKVLNNVDAESKEEKLNNILSLGNKKANANNGTEHK